MTPPLVRLEADGPVGRLILDRPPLNVLNLPMLDQLIEQLAQVRRRAGLKVLLVSGAGKAFCAGVDVADHTADRVAGMLDRFHRAILDLMALEIPVVAAVQGAALGGGCELAMACDIVLARDDARLGQPEIQLAVLPPVAAALLPRLIGRQAALDLILTGRVVSGGEAREAGLVRLVWPEQHFAREVEAYVARLAGLSGPVLRLAKDVVDGGLRRTFPEALAEAERRYLDDLMALRDPHEGLAAFLAKRPPVWQEA
ncbi:MAG: enoyl-CoA hydratase/isomerase family protein [Gemmatimonadales bacterium]